MLLLNQGKRRGVRVGDRAKEKKGANRRNYCIGAATLPRAGGKGSGRPAPQQLLLTGSTVRITRICRIKGYIRSSEMPKKNQTPLICLPRFLFVILRVYRYCRYCRYLVARSVSTFL